MQKKHKASSFFLAPKSSVNPKLGCCGFSCPVSPTRYKVAPPSAAPDMILKPDV